MNIQYLPVAEINKCIRNKFIKVSGYEDLEL